jgi:hypothetical protein
VEKYLAVFLSLYERGNPRRSSSFNPFFGRVLLKDIDAFMVGDFMAELGSARLSAKIPEEHLQLLRLLFEIAVEYDLMATSPIRPKVHRRKSTARKICFFC